MDCVDVLLHPSWSNILKIHLSCIAEIQVLCTWIISSEWDLVFGLMWHKARTQPLCLVVKNYGWVQLEEQSSSSAKTILSKGVWGFQTWERIVSWDMNRYAISINGAYVKCSWSHIFPSDTHLHETDLASLWMKLMLEFHNLHNSVWCLISTVLILSLWETRDHFKATIGPNFLGHILNWKFKLCFCTCSGLLEKFHSHVKSF